MQSASSSHAQRFGQELTTRTQWDYPLSARSEHQADPNRMPWWTAHDRKRHSFELTTCKRACARNLSGSRSPPAAASRTRMASRLLLDFARSSGRIKLHASSTADRMASIISGGYLFLTTFPYLRRNRELGAIVVDCGELRKSHPLSATSGPEQSLHSGQPVWLRRAQIRAGANGHSRP